MNVDEFESLVRQVAARVRQRVGVATWICGAGRARRLRRGRRTSARCVHPAGARGLPPQPAEIRLYYRTFHNLHETDGRYDVAREIEQTLRHEFVHHAGHLAGSDRWMTKNATRSPASIGAG